MKKNTVLEQEEDLVGKRRTNTTLRRPSGSGLRGKSPTRDENPCGPRGKEGFQRDGLGEGRNLDQRVRRINDERQNYGESGVE